MLIFGTRPEAIKMLPVAIELRRNSDVNVQICVTGQHREMLAQVMDLFGERADFDLDIMRNAQGLEQITTAVLKGVGEVLRTTRPDRVLVHGDTTTTMAAALAAFYEHIPVGHVEAGLRSGDRSQPWPEEINRRVTDVIADLFFAPTASSKANLLNESIAAGQVHVTGNTVIDALLIVQERLSTDKARRSQIEKRFQFLEPNKPMILVTGHRRENFGNAFRDICLAIKELGQTCNAQIVYPVHLNPNVRQPVGDILGNVPNVHLIEPQDYEAFVFLMGRSTLILTDSGGIQEEAPALGKPVFVMRNVTERPEAVEAGTVKLVGTDRHTIVSQVRHILKSPAAYRNMASAHNPYGDGLASKRIGAILHDRPYEEFKP